MYQTNDIFRIQKEEKLLKTVIVCLQNRKIMYYHKQLLYFYVQRCAEIVNLSCRWEIGCVVYKKKKKLTENCYRQTFFLFMYFCICVLRTLYIQIVIIFLKRISGITTFCDCHHCLLVTVEPQPRVRGLFTPQIFSAVSFAVVMEVEQPHSMRLI